MLSKRHGRFNLPFRKVPPVPLLSRFCEQQKRPKFAKFTCWEVVPGIPQIPMAWQDYFDSLSDPENRQFAHMFPSVARTPAEFKLLQDALKSAIGVCCVLASAAGPLP